MEIDCIWFKPVVNTPCQLIVYERGAYGSFIFQLVSTFLDQDFVPELYSNASCPCKIINLTAKSSHYIYNSELKRHTYELADPFDASRAMVLRQHKWPVHKDFFKRWPLGKIIYITSTPEDHPRLRANWLIKARFSAKVANFADPYVQDRRIIDMTPEQIKRAIYNVQTTFITFPEDEIPNDYPDSIIKIKCNDVLVNKNLVLEQLSQITGKPIPEKLHDFYDRYLEAQEKLRLEFFPYINPI